MEHTGPIAAADANLPMVRSILAAIEDGRAPAVRLVETRRSTNGRAEALLLDIDVERPQKLALAIRGTEPIAVIISDNGQPPSVLAVRSDFPETMHQNWTPEGTPPSLCVDDRPWPEAQLSWTAEDFLRRIQFWLARAASGDLHDRAQPLDPYFYPTSDQIIIAQQVLEGTGPRDLIAFRRSDNDHMMFVTDARPDLAAQSSAPPFVAMVVTCQPGEMRRLRFVPRDLGALDTSLVQFGVSLDQDVHTLVRGMHGVSGEQLRRLHAHMIIVIDFTIAGPDDRTATDLRAFISNDTLGEIGIKLGLLEVNDTDVAGGRGYVRRIAQAPRSPDPISLYPAEVMLSFDRDMAARLIGLKPANRPKAVLVGAGSLGSQLALNLAREGRFDWTVIDQDILLPHNLARHALFPGHVGGAKAQTLASLIEALQGASAKWIVGDILSIDATGETEAAQALQSADLLIDASASVAASRHLSDLDLPARRISAFFNPSGTALVLLTEGRDRNPTLRDLEAQYHRLIQEEPLLKDHLSVSGDGFRYSGSCRALSNRIPASAAALLSAIASSVLAQTVDDPRSSIQVWSKSPDCSVTRHHRIAAKTRGFTLGDWCVKVDDQVIASLHALRANALPAETGGALLGLVDVSRKSIHLVQALPCPPDSVGSPAKFERGVSGLGDRIAEAIAMSTHQIRYIGEWHSHPRAASVSPSRTDLRQLAWLADELGDEGIPAVMVIGGDAGRFSILLGTAEAGQF